MITLMTFVLLFCMQQLPDIPTPMVQVGLFNYSADIGRPDVKGSAAFNAADSSYAIKGAGYNIWFKRDEFHYLFNKMTGDFLVSGRLKLDANGKNVHRKIGWMIRESENDEAAHISATIHGDGTVVLQWRSAEGKSMRDPEDEVRYPGKNIERVQLERKGNLITMSVAAAEGEYTVVGSHEMQGLDKQVLAGLFLCSHDPEVLESGIASEVTVQSK